MGVKLSADLVSTIKGLRQVLTSMLSTLRGRINNPEKFTENYQSFSVLLKDSLQDSGGFSEESDLRLLAEFYASVLVIASYSGFDNDKNLNSHIDSSIKALQENLGELNKKLSIADADEVSDINNDIKKVEGQIEQLKNTKGFGYADLKLALVSMTAVQDNDPSTKGVGVAESTLLSYLRLDVSAADFASQKLYELDINLVKFLCSPAKLEYDTDLLNLATSDSGVNTKICETVDMIGGVYKCAFADGFGLQAFYGVLTSDNDAPAYTIGLDNKLDVEGSAVSIFRSVWNKLSSFVNVKVSSKRQFDFAEIMSSAVPVYYPKKIIEIAMGREMTTALSEDIYRPFAGVPSFDNYFAAQVSGYITEFINQCVVKYYDSKGITTLVEMQKDNSDGGLQSMLTKVKESMCCAFIIPRYNVFNGRLNEIAVRVVDVCRSLSADLTKPLFGSLSGNDALQYAPALNFSDGFVLDDGSRLIYNVYNYSHIYNVTVAKAEPLFAYKAVEMFKARGISVSSDNILMGETLEGKPLFASEASTVDSVLFTPDLLHCFIAGSRAGKGVMTMNIVGACISGGKPVFYIDRKPDMANVFYQLSGGTKDTASPMFLFNGNNNKDDYAKYFSDSSVQLKGWDANIPPELKKIFGGDVRYYNPGSTGLSDLVYFRAVLFCLGIIAARAVYEDSDREVYKSLGGDTGIVVVIDEIAGWTNSGELGILQNKFCQRQYNLDGKEEKLSASADKIRDLEGKIKVKQVELANAKNEVQAAKQEIALQNLQEQLSMAKKKSSEVVSNEALYATQLITKFKESASYLKELGVAGMRNKERYLTDIFAISQEIIEKLPVNKEEPWGYTREGQLKAVDAGTSLFWQMLFSAAGDGLDVDWALGFNKGKGYFGAPQKGSDVYELLDQRYWIYCQGIAAKDEALTSVPSGGRWFKPYLVLNDSAEKDPKAAGADSGKYAYVAQCRKTVNSKVPGLWDTVRLKHVPNPDEQTVKPQYGTLNAGIGLEGLIDAMVSTTSRQVNCVDVLAKSGEIANYVAKCCGYSNFKAMIFDFTPRGLFSVGDIVSAVKDHSYFSKPDRVKIYEKFNRLDLVFDNAPSSSTPSSSGLGVPADESGDGDFNIWGDEPDTSSSQSEQSGGTTASEAQAQQSATPVPEPVQQEEDELTYQDIFTAVQNAIQVVMSIPRYEALINRLGGANRVTTTISLYYAKKYGVSV